MIINVKEFYRPETVKEALELEHRKPNSKYLGGGVILSKTLGPSTETLIDLSKLPLNYISVDADSVKIGAMTRISQIYNDTGLKKVKSGELLSMVAGYVASEQIRNMASMGGAVFARHYWSDIIPTLLVVDAKLTFEKINEEFKVELSEFLNPKNSSKFKKVILKEIEFPTFDSEYEFSFEKFSRTKIDIATLNLAAFYKVSDKKIEDIRLSSGGLETNIKRMLKVEKYLTGKNFSRNNLEKAADLLLEQVKPFKDLRGSSEYKSKLIKAMFSSIKK